MRDKILIVDDIEINRIILSEILSQDYEILEAQNGLEAIDVLYNAIQLPSAVLLDIMMPEMDGFEVLALIKANANTEKIPVLFITAADASINESRGLKDGAVDFISKPFNADVVKARVDNHIQLMRYRTVLEAMVEEKSAELIATHERILETLATIIEYRSLESGTHIRRSSELSKILVSTMLKRDMFRLALLEFDYHSIVKAVALHDIGKVGIPDNILLKPGKLTPEEFDVVKEHTVIGGKIIDSISQNATTGATYLMHCKDICLHHHERWDGNGYPDRIAEADIPLSARILSIVDVYDALVTRRCYKEPFKHTKAVELIVEGSGTQFDPNIVDVFMDVEGQFEELEMAIGDL